MAERGPAPGRFAPEGITSRRAGRWLLWGAAAAAVLAGILTLLLL